VFALNADKGIAVAGFRKLELEVDGGSTVYGFRRIRTEDASSIDGVGACDKRSPIWTVAEDAIDESRRCRDDPGRKI
jgi:hypothetical protein